MKRLNPISNVDPPAAGFLISLMLVSCLAQTPCEAGDAALTTSSSKGAAPDAGAPGSPATPSAQKTPAKILSADEQREKFGPKKSAVNARDLSAVPKRCQMQSHRRIRSQTDTSTR